MNAGEDVELACVVRGRPVETLVWLHNGVPIPGTLHQVGLRDPWWTGEGENVLTRTLRLSAVQLEAEGMYQCWAKSHLDNAIDTIHLGLKGEIEFYDGIL